MSLAILIVHPPLSQLDSLIISHFPEILAEFPKQIFSKDESAESKSEIMSVMPKILKWGRYNLEKAILQHLDHTSSVKMYHGYAYSLMPSLVHNRPMETKSRGMWRRLHVLGICDWPRWLRSHVGNSAIWSPSPQAAPSV